MNSWNAERMMRVIIKLVLVCLVFWFGSKYLMNVGDNKTTVTKESIFKSRKQRQIASVEDIEVEKLSADVWTLKGMIRNDITRPIEGRVKIKFLNRNGDIVRTFRAYVNDGDPLKPGQAGEFHYTAKAKDFDGIVKYDVEFYEK